MDAEQRKAAQRRNIVAISLIAATLYGMEEGHKFSAREISRLPLAGQVSSVPTDIATLNLDQLKLLVARSMEATGVKALPDNLDDVFSLRAKIEAPPKPEYILPPVMEVTKSPPEDLRRVFRENFNLDAVASKGAFFNGRYVPVGGTVFAGKAPGKDAEMLVVLDQVQGRSAYVTVNSESLEVAMSYGKSDETAIE